MLGIVNTQRGEKKYQPFMIAFTKNPHDSSRPLEEAIEEEENKHKQRRARRETRTRPKKRSDLSYYDHDRYNPYLSCTLIKLIFMPSLNAHLFCFSLTSKLTSW